MSQAINVTHRLRGVVPRPCWAEGLLGACGRCYEPRMTPGILCALCSQYPLAPRAATLKTSPFDDRPDISSQATKRGVIHTDPAENSALHLCPE